jgi:hypothetical protein
LAKKISGTPKSWMDWGRGRWPGGTAAPLSLAALRREAIMAIPF